MIFHSLTIIFRYHALLIFFFFQNPISFLQNNISFPRFLLQNNILNILPVYFTFLFTQNRIQFRSLKIIFRSHAFLVRSFHIIFRSLKIFWRILNLRTSDFNPLSYRKAFAALFLVQIRHWYNVCPTLT